MGVMSDKTYRILSMAIQGVMTLTMVAVLVTAISVFSGKTELPPVSESSAESQIDPADNQTYSTANDAVSQETEAPVMAPQEHLYTIREYHDHIGVFLRGQQTPYLEVGVRVASLPEADQVLLKNGIYADNRAELIAVLQDYDG